MSEARRETTPVFWFVVGSQHLYGPETLERVESQARRIVRSFNDDASLPYKLDMKPLMTTPEAIAQLCAEANTDPTCAGVLTWMHTFSPAKMWIGGLTVLKKPLLHLHTQYHDAIPWKTVDMNFMNLNQAAHGDREFAFIGARLGVRRKVLAGHWADRGLRRRLAEWMCTAVAVNEGHSLKVARFGDNMRQVAVTEGDKVAAQAQFGWAVHAYGVGDLVDCMAYVSEAEVESLVQTYRDMYEIAKGTLEDAPYWSAVREQARMELGLRRFLYQGGFTAFTTNFEDLHGLRQLPGLAVQRLMADGFGFGGEGDWKTAALVRVVKRMAGFEGTSFMEDYTYHLVPGEESTLGAHMLEVCPTIAADTPRLEVHPLSIGGKEPPARLVFTGKPGAAVVASLVDLGDRFRLIVNEVEAVFPPEAMSSLPVARVLWKPQPSWSVATEGWLYAGGAHHTVFSYAVTAEQLADWAAMTGVECVVIDRHTSLLGLRQALAWNDAAWRLR